MNVRVSLFLSFLLIGLFSLAQEIKTSEDFDVQLSKPFGVVDARVKLYQNSKEYVVAIKYSNNEVNLQSFDGKTLTQIASKEYKDFDRNVEFALFQQLEGRFYLFYAVWDGKNEKEQLFQREIDPKTASFKGAGKILISVDGKLTGNMVNKGWYNIQVVDKFNFESSKDKNRLLIYYRLKPEVRDDSKSHDKIGLYVFDSSLDLQWKKTVTMPYTEMKMDFFDQSINSEGDVYVLAKIYNDNTTDDRKSNRDEDPNYHMELFIINSENQEIKREKITLEGKFINSLLLHEASHDFMVIGGYYRDPETKYGAEGVYLIKVKKDGEQYDQYFHEIPLGILNQNEKRGQVRRNSKDEEKGRSSLKNLYLDKIVTLDDGSVVLIGEQYWIEVHTSVNANGRVNTYYTYHYEDILVSRIGKEGQLNWMHKIPKDQEGRAVLGGMSYKYMSNTDSHYLLYLDNIKNLTLDKEDTPERHVNGAGGFLTAYKIHHGSGVSSKHSLFDLRDVKGIKAYQYEADRVIQLSDNEIAVEVYKKKKEDIWIRLKLK